MAQRDRIVRYIEENLCTEALCAQGVADYFQISVSSVSREMKKETGMGFLDYVHSRRIAMARELLDQGNRSVKDTAREVGYSGSLAFSRAFRKYEGTTPGAYRNRKK